ncbi:glycosyltransferase [Lithospermum erythrorhizon]|uniref:Glycosyltransferase n=1 Tax=Lithospermum erythrorhizon TaxID=34254 RepID=A0AAV3NUN6_LITER
MRSRDNKSVRKHKYLEWLDQQPEKSVIHVAFGTMTSASEQEARELAMGLEQSKQRFIWGHRDADKGNIFDEKVRKIKLPEGFEERVQDYGIIVRDWAPQVEILGHKSVGGFMSHCGWNSCIESLTMGVPIAAWPMHSDQAMNTVLITEVLKVGTSWKDMRKKVEELEENLRKSREEGGVAHLELDSFIAHTTRF